MTFDRFQARVTGFGPLRNMKINVFHSLEGCYSANLEDGAFEVEVYWFQDEETGNDRWQIYRTGAGETTVSEGESLSKAYRAEANFYRAAKR